MNKPETVADVLAEIRTNPVPSIYQKNDWANRIERAMAAGAVPVAPSFDREHAADIVSQLVNSHTSAWIAGEKVSAAVAAHSRQYCKQAMVEAANFLEQLISVPPAVPVESIRCGVSQCGMTYARMPKDGRCHACGATLQHAPPPASVPDGWRNVLQRARQGLGAGGALGTPGSRQRELEVEIGGMLLDHIEDGLELLSATPTTPEPRT